ncbi:MAG: hypothetical protein JWO38_71 [Gemmataceae bacterium]|nr:hypothetical protein [Gemmataceae bacterium]
MPPEPVPAYAYLNARVLPLDRGDRYEEPLAEALAENGFAEITGGGTGQSEAGEIDYCGIDIDLHDLPNGVPFVCDFLAGCGAPKGSKLQYEEDGQPVEVPFGVLEGLAIYLNGTDLPDEVYATSDVNELYQELNRLLGDRGSIQGYWQGPTETALYLYGYSVDEMRGLIDACVAAYPLCQRARLVQIA